jgi:hypothetical protein
MQVVVLVVVSVYHLVLYRAVTAEVVMVEMRVKMQLDIQEQQILAEVAVAQMMIITLVEVLEVLE